MSLRLAGELEQQHLASIRLTKIESKRAVTTDFISRNGEAGAAAVNLMNAYVRAHIKLAPSLDKQRTTRLFDQQLLKLHALKRVVVDTMGRLQVRIIQRFRSVHPLRRQIGPGRFYQPKAHARIKTGSAVLTRTSTERDLQTAELDRSHVYPDVVDLSVVFFMFDGNSRDIACDRDKAILPHQHVLWNVLTLATITHALPFASRFASA